MRARVASVMVLLTIALAILMPNHPGGRVPAEDAGVFFYAAQRVLDGGAPYRDVWDHKPPGVYLVDALGLFLGGALGVWILQLVTVAVAALAGWLALRAVFGDAPALVGSIAWLVAAPRLFLEDARQTSFVELYALPLQFGALALLGSGGPARSRALAIGALGGAAFLLKPTLVGVWIAIVIVMALARRRAAAWIVLGAAAPVALVVAWALAREMFAEMVDQALVYNRAYAAFASIDERLDAIASGLRLTLPSGLAVIAVASWVYAIAARRAHVPLVTVALVALPLELLLATTGRGYHYYFLAWLPAMAVLVAVAAAEVHSRLGARAALATLAVVTLVMCAQPALLVARLAAIHDDGAIRAAAADIAARARSDDEVLVWGSHSEVLVLAGRLSPTRYVYQYAALSTRGYATPAKVDDLLRDLERRRPALIVDASADSFVTPPLDRTGFRAWTSPEAQYASQPETERIIAFVESGYERSGRLAGTGWPVWRLRAP